ncbi:NAD-dependent epimerase/dehydratase family protein [Rhizobium lentis]|uniref:NAD-dependent epimerase/dehydratase family protein n=1 Tax=Rhizobium lentis TaxID=1138194 RepID=A0A9Q3M3R7_9HYPH|nr:NAD-dependent epimerase/dehydratase family protein [Rhizobium lentis]MBX4972511.1 NAD-dependent epimerase/dehydratase family protein [Rhizobium lentis]MBX4999576.1 NAD-dependent epimerase/dehydratase family protein [Rhizobium lentis]MBX5010673.1 NAD-dependent epimerase/dehydratase family protein [Rhizobium lentis]MBX5017317.1 NAD-dependent epimerase/dehydratase family protein [Rhizobium lentis]MBX5021058.1 NAD-dependent epimerase/dehydratase family protein [Rhizobium lentis]
MRVLVIGATGHVGTYLVPRLVEAGHDVVTISRGAAKPYTASRAWASVDQRQMDRAEMERKGDFGPAVRALNADIVIDMICFRLESAEQLVKALSGHIGHFLHTGTIWTHGYPVAVPTREEAPKSPFGDYGIQKAAIEAYLLQQARLRGFPVTIIHPGHIVGPGWAPLNPAGNFNLQVFSTLARGEALALPNFGLETVHHVHADDVAAMFMGAIANWNASTGESFHAVSEAALTLRGYAESMSRWFGQEPKLTFAPFDVWAQRQTAEDAEATWEHIARSPNCSIAKARHLLGYSPRYTSLQAVQEAVGWMVGQGRIET